NVERVCQADAVALRIAREDVQQLELARSDASERWDGYRFAPPIYDRRCKTGVARHRRAAFCLSPIFRVGCVALLVAGHVGRPAVSFCAGGPAQSFASLLPARTSVGPP